MRFSLFYHSLVSDWNHGNAHFLRGVVSELLRCGHQVRVYEPEQGWSRRNLLLEGGEAVITEFHQVYPQLSSTLYTQESLDVAAIARDSDVVIVHEWNEPWLIDKWALARQHSRREDAAFRLLFHDTHHRAVSAPEELTPLQLQRYDGVLAFGEVLSQVYRERGWNDRVWTWHEAADTRVFRPLGPLPREGEVVWVGNWGDDERTRELEEFLFRPVAELGLRCRVHGVRYPAPVLEGLRRRGVDYRGWLPNFRVPELFARFATTVHVPRRAYARQLPGIPTIRPFEAMACGIPLVSAPWRDSEGLFEPGSDYLVAHSADEMKKHLRDILNDPDLARQLSENALRTIRARHTCGHRVKQLLGICAELGLDGAGGRSKELASPGAASSLEARMVDHV